MPNRRVKVLFVLPDLTGGGAERILLEIMKNLDRGRFEGALALFRAEGRFMGEVPPDFRLIELNESRHYRAEYPRLVFKLRRAAKSEGADIVFSAINVANFAAIPAAKLARARAIAYEMSDPYSDIMHEHRFPRISSCMLRATYPFADVPLALSKGIGESLVRNFGVDPGKVRVSYTPFNFEFIAQRAAEPADHPWFDEPVPVVVGMGSLTRTKGFDVLIRAMAEVNRRTRARLMLVGQGPERDALGALARELGVDENVHFAGFHENPWKLLSRARVFVLSSRHEGFGNVMVEAMMCGVPVVATDCPVGPREILMGGEAGVLVPNEDHSAMAVAIAELIPEGAARDALIERQRERIREFDRSNVMRKIEAVMVELASRR